MNDEPTESSTPDNSIDDAPDQRIAGQFDADVAEPNDEFWVDEPARGNTIGLRGGLAAMLAGAVLLTVGMVSTTAAYSGRPNCPKGSILVADFDHVPGDDGGTQNPSDDKGQPGGTYVLVYPEDKDSPVTIIEGDHVGGLWISTSPISAIVVSGGIGSTRTRYTPAQDSGVFSHKDLPLIDGQTPDVEHVRFCSPSNAATTTTAPSTTDPYTTAPSTTAVDQTTTTMTDGSTTTTVVDQTTTTVTDGSTTTTVVDQTTTTVTDGSTTTTEVSPTSIVGSTTTTTVSEETTTTIDGTTTTTGVEQTTTTLPEVRGRVTVQTEVTEHDDDEEGQVLALTGSSSLPLVALGTVLLLGGGTVVLVSRSRMRADS